MSGGAWQSKASRSLTTTDVLNQYIDINLSCNFDATDANQFIGLDNFTGVTGLYVDRVTVTPSDGSPTRIIKAEERTATNAIPLNVVNDPTASDGMAHYATQASSHVKSRAWGLHASDVGLPRFSDIPATVTIRIRSDHINEQTATDPGTVLCSSQQYTCPAGQVLNGYVCEDVDRQDYLANPNCVNLGYDPDTESEAFYCTEQKLDECIEMPADCTLVNSACVYNDEVPGSPTPGACLATEKTYTCPVPGKTVSKVSCGYDPMCYNGNCFTPPDGQCQGVTEEVTKTRISSCFEHREQTIGQCSLTVTKDPYGGNQTYTLGTDCQQYVDNPQCVQVPVLTDDEGNYPTTTAFSCLGDPVNDCDRIMADTACDTANPTRTCVDYEDMNGSNGRCVHTQLDYTCTDTLTMPGDECTQDLSKVLISMEAGRQAGNYMDINEMRLFKGEYSRCDRRAASFLGAGIG
ncbi:MAG: conjugal transfer protein TraN, partial [Halothiobacillus sp.]|nr:conjugal transfer protein TraN [Halothiobacillus sp.]